MYGWSVPLPVPRLKDDLGMPDFAINASGMPDSRIWHARSMNLECQVRICGMPGDEADILSGSSGMPILVPSGCRLKSLFALKASFLASNQPLAAGERQERTSWHNIAIFNERLAEIAEQYLRKGSQVYIEGQLETRKWQDQAGNDRYTTEVVLKNFRGELTMLGGRSDDVPNMSNQQNETQPFRSIESDGSNQNNLGPDDLDDEIPF